MSEIYIVLKAFCYDGDPLIGLANTAVEARAMARAYEMGAGPERGGGAAIQLWEYDAELGWLLTVEDAKLGERR